MSRHFISTKPGKQIWHVTNSVPPKTWPMSLEEHDIGMSFGWDYAMGYWFQLWRPIPGKFDACGEPVEELVVDQSSRFDRLAQSHLLEFIHYYASPVELEQLKNVIACIGMDLPC